MPKLQIPDQTLRAVYLRELPQRPTWPRTYEKAIATPIIRALLDTIARAQIPAVDRLKASRSPQRYTTIPGTPPATVKPRWHGPHLAPGEIDRKRAAAGDRDTEPPELEGT